MKRTRLIILTTFLIFTLTACVTDHVYYCDNVEVSVYNDTNHIIYTSITSTYCSQRNYIYPGERIIFDLGEMEIDEFRNDQTILYYRFDSPGSYDESITIDLDGCRNDVYIE